MKAFIVIVITASILMVVAYLTPASRLVIDRALDRTPPTIDFLESGPEQFAFTLSESISGLHTVLVTAKQAQLEHELYREEFPEGTGTRSITIPISLQAHGFKEGDVNIEVEASDNALSFNQSRATQTRTLDFVRPKLELLSLQHIAHQGGAELVVYRATDQSLKETGIEIAGAVFPGFPISFVDDKADAPDVYGALFGIPFDFDPKEAKVTLFAVDQVGNRSDQQIYFRLGKFNQAKVNSRLSQDFLQRKVPELFDKYKLIADHIPSVDLASESGLLEAFRFVNEDFRKSLDTELATVLNAPITPRQGIGAFIKPMGSATSSNLGEKRTYTFDSKPISYSVHNGLDLASVQHDDVLAAQSGIVQLAKDFGIYGEAVVIDHGLGVKSLYGHLSSIQVQVGQQVDQGQVIGQTGQTGLAGGDHLHFEIRVRSTPVNPIEWWDSKWINDNIDGKLASLKE